MSLFHLRGFALLLPLMLGTSGQVLAQSAPVPPLIEQLNDGNWLPQDEAEALRDELYYQRAIYAYMTMLPALNVIGMRDGSEKKFGAGYNVLPIWKDRMDSRAWVPTPNADVIYSMSYLDLKETGPLVVAAPPNVIGARRPAFLARPLREAAKRNPRVFMDDTEKDRAAIQSVVDKIVFYPLSEFDGKMKTKERRMNRSAVAYED